MKRGGKYEYAIQARDLDMNAQATYISVINYILQAAGDDADRNGFGVRDLGREECSWVLSRVAVEFGRRLAQDERITVRTWVNEVSRLMTTRNMEVTLPGGEVVARAVTQWAMIDIGTRTAVDLSSHLDYGKAIVDEPCPIAKPARIGAVAPSEETAHKVVYSDIDFNRHVNSMKYVEWMFDMLPEERLDGGELTRIDINFLHEARLGETLAVGMQAEEKRTLFEIRGEVGTAMCKVSLNWK